VTKRKPKDHGRGEVAPQPETSGPPGTPTQDELAAAELFTAPAATPATTEVLPSAEAARPPEERTAEFERLRAEAEEYLDGWQRARAEFANYKKRVEREQQESHAIASAKLIVHFLSVLDDLQRALKDRPTQGEAAAWAEGVDLICRKLQALLEAEGVETIPADGAPFDPTLHEAVTHEESGDHHEGQVIEVIQQGYRLGERVLRPALVRVAK